MSAKCRPSAPSRRPTSLLRLNKNFEIFDKFWLKFLTILKFLMRDLKFLTNLKFLTKFKFLKIVNFCKILIETMKFGNKITKNKTLNPKNINFESQTLKPNFEILNPKSKFCQKFQISHQKFQICQKFQISQLTVSCPIVRIRRTESVAPIATGRYFVIATVPGTLPHRDAQQIAQKNLENKKFLHGEKERILRILSSDKF